MLTILRLRYLAWQWFESILVSFALSSLTFSIIHLLISSTRNTLLLTLLTFCTILTVSVYKRNLLLFTQRDLVAYLNGHYKVFQDSCDLLLAEATNLTQLELVQQVKIAAIFTRLYKEIRLPNKLAHTTLLLFFCIVISTILYNASPLYSTVSSANMASRIQTTGSNTDSSYATLEELTIHIQPPAYTGMKASFAGSTGLTIPEGSTTTWTVIFSQPCTDVSLIVSGLDTVGFKKQHDKSFTLHHSLKQSGFYQLQWISNGKIIQSDFHKVEIVKDNAPKIIIKNLEQFTALTHTDNLTIRFDAHLSDDYGLSNAQIIATVSKGSGESVKFREEKMRFKIPSIISGKQILASTSFDLLKLGLEPGDELYFYVEAFDTKQPIPSRNRTETYFISLQDTANFITSTDEGLGVDLMPEYFRSQRQIIIDTEKLLRNKKTLSKEEFNFTSNALGYDQKVLRLRYSEFMGEEFVSGIGPQADHEQEHEGEEKDVVKEFGHVHDSENEHNLVEEKHDHEPENTDPDKKTSPLEEFVHAHDDAEEATFYIQSVKAKLRAALTLMWDAELQLRLFEPQKSLPYQYKILTLLKEISNDSRIYVHRTGFDPPPIKEDKRYTADLQEIQNSTNRYAVQSDESLHAIREAITLLHELEQGQATIVSERQRSILSKAGQELARLSVDKPLAHVEGLRLLRILISTELTAGDLQHVATKTQRELLRAIPPKTISVNQKDALLHSLDKSFINILDQEKND